MQQLNVYCKSTQFSTAQAFATRTPYTTNYARDGLVVLKWQKHSSALLMPAQTKTGKRRDEKAAEKHRLKMSPPKHTKPTYHQLSQCYKRDSDFVCNP